MPGTQRLRSTSHGLWASFGLGVAILLGAPAVAQASESWAALEEDRGVTLIPVLACRTPDALARVTATAPENRPVLAKFSVKRGECTRLPHNVFFVLIGRTGDALHVRTVEQGRLWVSQTTRIPGLAEMHLVGKLAKEPSGAAPDHGLTTDEREAVKAQLSKKETVSGFGGRAQIGGGSHFDQIRLVGWSPVLGGSNSRHPRSDGVGLDRCAQVRVRYDGSGSRLVSPSSFTARFAGGETRSGQKLLSSLRLRKGESGTGVVCFGGNYLTNIVALELR